MCSGRVSSSCSTSGTRRVNLVTNPVESREWGKDREVFTTSGTYPWSFVTQIFHSCRPSHGGDRKIFEVMTSTYHYIVSNDKTSITSILGPSMVFCMFLTLYFYVFSRQFFVLCPLSCGHCIFYPIYGSDCHIRIFKLSLDYCAVISSVDLCAWYGNQNIHCNFKAQKLILL